MNLNFSSLRYVRQALTIGIVVISAMLMLGACNWYNIGIGQRCCVDPNPLPTAPSTIVPLTTTSTVNQAKAQQCANMLGIHWTYEDGATERLDAFEACMSATTTTNNPQSYDGYGYTTSEPKATVSPRGYVCRVEPSTTAVGYEVIAYPVSTPTNKINPLGFYVPCPK